MYYSLSTTEQRNVLFSIIRIASKRLQNFNQKQTNYHQQAENLKPLQGVAGLISALIADNSGLKRYLFEWLTSNNATGVGSGRLEVRAIIAVVAQNQGKPLGFLQAQYCLKIADLLQDVFRTTLTSFGDKLYIKHAPILQQEGLAMPSALPL